MNWFFATGLFLITFHTAALISQDVILQKLEAKNGTFVEGEYRITDLRVSKYNRSTYVINSEMELFNILDNSYVVSFFFFYINI